MTHIAKSVVKVSIGSTTGHRVARIVQPGGVIPDGVDEELLKRLVDRGLIEAVDEPSEASEYDSFKVDELKAEIDRRNGDRADDAKVQVGGDGKKADLVAALVADDAKQSQ